MRANLNYLYKKFVEFNETIFKSSLPPIEIKISRGGKVLGCLHKKTSRLGLRTSYSMTFTNRYDMPEQMLEDILIHEMIHYRVALDGIADTSMHGDCFKAIMNQINREHGRNISLRVELPKQVLESDNMSDEVKEVLEMSPELEMRGNNLCAI